MGLRDAKKILLVLYFIIVVAIFYLFLVEPIFIKKDETQIDQVYVIPDISVDKTFFDKIQSLKNNTVTLDENSVVKNNPFSK